ncbi:hypothetical protein D3C81_1056330 [compost metagenome]
MVAGGLGQAAVEVVGHQVDPVQRLRDARQLQTFRSTAFGGGDGQQVMALAAFLVQSRAQLFQQHGEVVAVIRAVADVGIAERRVFPVDIQPVQFELVHQRDAAVDEARARGVGGGGFGEIAGAPAADRQHDLQRWIVRTLGDHRVQARRIDFLGQVHAAVQLHPGEGEVHHVELFRRQLQRRRAVHHIADHAR